MDGSPSSLLLPLLDDELISKVSLLTTTTALSTIPSPEVDGSSSSDNSILDDDDIIPLLLVIVDYFNVVCDCLKDFSRPATIFYKISEQKFGRAFSFGAFSSAI